MPAGQVQNNQECRFLGLSLNSFNPMRPLRASVEAIRGLFFHQKFSEVVLEEIDSRRVEVLAEKRGTTPVQLGKVLKKFSEDLYEVLSEKSKDKVAAIKKRIALYVDNGENKNILADLITESVGSTLVDLLYEPKVQTPTPGYLRSLFVGKLKTDITEDEKLLEAIVDMFLPDPQISEGSFSLASFFGGVVGRVTGSKKQEEARLRYTSLPKPVREAIEKFLKVEKIDTAKKEKIKNHTLPFDLDELKREFGTDDLCKRYILTIMNVLLREKIDAILEQEKDENGSAPIQAYIEKVLRNDNPDSPEVDSLKKLYDNVVGDLIPVFTGILPALFKKDHSIIDECMKVLSDHLTALSKTKSFIDEYKKTCAEIALKHSDGNALGKNEQKLLDEAFDLDVIQAKIVAVEDLNEQQKKIAIRVWGEDYLLCSEGELNKVKGKFLAEYPNYDFYAAFRIQREAHKALKENAPMSDFMGHQASTILDHILSDEFLEKIFSKVCQVNVAKDFLTIDVVRKFFPFFKLMARVYVHHLIKTGNGDEQDGGFFKRFGEMLSPESLKQMLVGSVLPNVKSGMMAGLVEGVLKTHKEKIITHYDRARIDKWTPEVKKERAKELRKVLRQEVEKVCETYGIDFETYKDDVRSYILKWMKELDACQIKQDATSHKLNSSNRIRQFIDLFFKVNPGQNVPIYGEVVEKVLFDVGNFPWWLRGIFGFFKGFISKMVTSMIDPYRSGDKIIARVVKDVFKESFGSKAKIEKALFDPAEKGEVSETIDQDLDDSIAEVAKFVFATSSYSMSQGSFPRVRRFFVERALGHEGTRVKKTISDLLQTTFFEGGSMVNESLVLGLMDKVVEREDLFDVPGARLIPSLARAPTENEEEEESKPANPKEITGAMLWG